ncbi:hypothetical protein ITJ66_16805 [Plantibacter sp. VKM Ac-2885]|uniref:hypothetical protein n=1 Tax=Plantibacter sp. VKM Ac-2885 TaxID=2783828 RepID=UPI00188AAF0D|nr:hypothetical protein [Plantibacter sp. VKM Ac-2885]MBF4514148.1 hypothetical protein [Plantibacter sp. VKM Ac-2885]
MDSADPMGALESISQVAWTLAGLGVLAIIVLLLTTMYVPLPRHFRGRLHEHEIYHYVEDRFLVIVGNEVVLSPQRVWNPFIIGLGWRNCTFYYLGHRRRGSLLNHWPRHRDAACSVVVINGSDLFDAVKDGRMYWRLWDHAIAADGYRGPAKVIGGVNPIRARAQKSPPK